jgi:hypothetical protein
MQMVDPGNGVQTHLWCRLRGPTARRAAARHAIRQPSGNIMSKSGTKEDLLVSTTSLRQDTGLRSSSDLASSTVEKACGTARRDPGSRLRAVIIDMDGQARRDRG